MISKLLTTYKKYIKSKQFLNYSVKSMITWNDYIEHNGQAIRLTGWKRNRLGKELFNFFKTIVISSIQDEENFRFTSSRT